MSLFRSEQEIEESTQVCPLCGRPLWVNAMDPAHSKYCESCNRVFPIKRVTVPCPVEGCKERIHRDNVLGHLTVNHKWDLTVASRWAALQVDVGFAGSGDGCGQARRS